MLGNNTKSTTVKAARPAVLQRERNATAGRGLQASRGLSLETRASAQTPNHGVPAERLGSAVTLVLSLALAIGGSLMVAQIWENLAMIR